MKTQIFTTRSLTTAVALASSMLFAGCQSAPNVTPANPAPSKPVPSTPNTQLTNQVLPDAVCNNSSQSVAITQGSVMQKGVVQGYNYCEYQVQLKAGQQLDVEFNSPSPQADAIVYDNADVDLSETYVATSNQMLPVRVLLTRNEARSGKAHPYSIKFNVR